MSKRRVLVGFLLTVVLMFLYIALRTERSVSQIPTETPSANSEQSELITSTMGDESFSQSTDFDRLDFLSDMQEEQIAIFETMMKLYPIAGKRTIALIQSLKAETLEESVRLLDDSEMYFRLAPLLIGQLHSVSWPLAAGTDNETVTLIFANRRFVKVLQQSRLLDKESSVRMLGDFLEEAFRNYDGLYDLRAQALASLTELSDSEKPPTLATVVSNREDGQPTLEGSRMGVLAALLIAGQLKLTELHDTVEKIVAKAIEQRDTAYAQEPTYEAYDNLVFSGIYNRLILSTAMMGTSADPALQEAADHILGEYVYETKLTTFDALRTNYDRGMIMKTDWTRGEVIIDMPGHATDEHIDVLWDLYRQ